ncbi:MAG: hypothetical protein ACOYM2_16325 [Rectinemataceae bacterium]
MLLPLYTAILVAVLFYVLVPVLGAFHTHRRWRNFRSRLVELSGAAELDELVSVGGTAIEGEAVTVRFSGDIEGIEGEGRIWLRGKGATAVVDLGKAHFHVLADEGGGQRALGRNSFVESLPWQRVRMVPEGTKLFAGGLLRFEGGTPVICGTGKEPLIALSWTGDEKSLLERAIAGGRKENEYWSSLSRASLGLGIGLQAILLLLIWPDAFPSIRYLTFLVGFSPILCLLPPGLPFFFLYVRFWRRALLVRIERDVLTFPTNSFAKNHRDQASASAFSYVILSGLFLALDLCVNLVLAIWIWRMV